jgi:hypothetical protein
MGAGSAADVKDSHALFREEQAQSENPQAQIDGLEEAVVPSSDGAIGVSSQGHLWSEAIVHFVPDRLGAAVRGKRKRGDRSLLAPSPRAPAQK